MIGGTIVVKNGGSAKKTVTVTITVDFGAGTAYYLDENGTQQSVTAGKSETVEAIGGALYCNGYSSVDVAGFRNIGGTCFVALTDMASIRLLASGGGVGN